MPAKNTSKTWPTLLPLLARHPLFAKESVEQNYPFTHEDIRRHAGWLDFVLLSDNSDVKWTEQLIAEFADQWDWEQLSYAALLMRDGNLSDDFVARFSDRWDGWVMDAMDGTLDEEDVSDEPTPHFDAALAEMKAKGMLPGPEEQAWHCEQSEGRWTEAMVRAKEALLDFSLLSHNQNVRWSVRLLLRYEGRWKWSALATNPAVWNRVLKAHGSQVLEWLAGVDLRSETRPEENPAEAGLSGLPPDVRDKVAQLRKVFGAKSRVVGALGPDLSEPDQE